ncbi:MAG: AAA family ATPase [Myxococcota bacterium]
MLDEQVRQGSRQITLVGPGGMGKTRLALHFAAQMEGESLFVELVDCEDDASALMETIIRALGFDAVQRQAREEAVRSLGLLLERNRINVLILDNMEHLIDEGAWVVSQLLEETSKLILLVTSRQRLRLALECVIRLEPFETKRSAPGDSAGVQLFLERLRAMKPGYVVDAEEHQRIGQIVELTDGLPLAIELAAARVPAWGTQELLRQLEATQNVSPVLRSKTRDRPERHRTLERVLLWSWNMLSPWQQMVLSQLAVFRGRFTLEDAAKVLDDGVQEWLAVLEAIEDLCDASLLVHGEQQDFHLLLHIRAFAWEKLPDAKQAALKLRQARYMRAKAEAHLATLAGDWTASLPLSPSERTHYAAVLMNAAETQDVEMWASALTISQVYNPSRGYPEALKPIQSALGQVLDHAHTRPELPLELRVQASAVRCRAMLMSARDTQAEEELARARSMAQTRVQKAIVEELTGTLLMDKTQRSEALACFQRAAGLFEQAGEEFLSAIVNYRGISAIHYQEKRIAQAEAMTLTSLDIFQRFGSHLMEANAKTALALIAISKGEVGHARTLLADAIVLLQVHAPGSEARAMRLLGDLVVNSGRFEEGLAHHNTAAALLETQAHVDGMLYGAQCRAVCLMVAGRMEDARDGLEESLGIARRLKRPYYIQFCLFYLTLLDWLEGRQAQALARSEHLHSQTLTHSPPKELLRTALKACIDPPSPESYEHSPHPDAGVEVFPHNGDRYAVKNALLKTFDKPRPELGLPSLVTQALKIAPGSVDTRLILTVLWRWRLTPSVSSMACWAASYGPEVLLVAERGELVRPPHDETVRDLSAQPLLATLLEALAWRYLEDKPALDIQTILALLWPGEQLIPRAGRNRVYQAINRLKKLGLPIGSNQGTYRLTGPMAMVPGGFSVGVG